MITLVLKIKNNKIYSVNDLMIKDISCPKKVQKSDFKDAKKPVFNCNHCNQDIVNTDFLSEEDIVDLLKDNVDTCISINLMNPIFERMD